MPTASRNGSCGDNICNTNEDPGCASDCKVKSFATDPAFNTNAQSEGIMFTVKATKDINVFSFGPVASKNGSDNCRAYTRAGDYQGYEGSGSGWSQIFHSTVTNLQTGVPFMVWLSTEVRVYAGSTQSFYISCSSGLRYNTGNDQGAQFVSGDGLLVNQGVATASLFGGVGGIAKFNGGIGYFGSP